ncbi:MAG TPA: D-tyrosyl-tRNA(Tyr) deacylase [Epulopiscium sp.]|nr:D-tyrosyl-tRNA(Tyr) deacylase [Candidatus Epulonipiscium sp.]
MRAVVQRVSKASVTVDSQVIGEIQKGLLVLVGIKADDTEKDMEYIINKIQGLRIFEDEDGKMNISVKDIMGSILIVPNFTLYGDARKGARPSFMASGSIEEAEKKYEMFIKKLKLAYDLVETGEFQADMQVELLNDGPVTILLDSEKLF